MSNIQYISDAMLCSNCGACQAICPKEAISYRSTSMGRLYAQVDEACIDCGLCVKVCPSVQLPHTHFQDMFVGDIVSVYVGKASDPAIFSNAQSGGACTAVLTYLFDTGAIDCALVCRMTFGNPPKVESVLITDKEQLSTTQKSCYTPVELLSKLREARSFKSIAVVGLPCHIEGLTNILTRTKLFANVTYKLGLICDRTLCGSIQEAMLSYVKEGAYKIDWRRKDFTQEHKYYPYQTAPVVVYGEGGAEEEYVMPNAYRFALKDMFTAPRCRVCFDKINVFADIVFGDPWRMPDIDEKHGESVIASRTEKGEALLQAAAQAEYLTLRARAREQLIHGQLISQRKQQAIAYTHAFNTLPPPLENVESYILQETGEIPDQETLQIALHEFRTFIENEKRSKDQIVQIARRKIASHIRHQRWNHFIIFRALRKIKRIIKP